MKKLICKLLGCKYVYNFPSMPSKCICIRCDNKRQLDWETLEWNDVESFNEKLGTDKEIKERWFKLK